jgi:hypothetical protein
MQQIGAPSDIASNGFRWSTQRFDPAFSAFDANVVDDFAVTGGATRLTRFEAVVWGFQAEFTGFGSVDSWSLEIYSSVAAAAGNLVGDVASEVFLPAQVVLGGTVNGIANTALLTIELAGRDIVLPDDQYWIGVIPRMDRAEGQIAVFTSQFAGAFPGGNDTYQVNPNGGYGFTSALRQQNAAYNLEGNQVPEPGAFLLTGTRSRARDGIIRNDATSFRCRASCRGTRTGRRPA